jgi:hypothetical protein
LFASLTVEFRAIKLQDEHVGHHINPVGQNGLYSGLAHSDLIVIDHSSVVLLPGSVDIVFDLHVQQLIEELGVLLLLS